MPNKEGREPTNPPDRMADTVSVRRVQLDEDRISLVLERYSIKTYEAKDELDRPEDLGVDDFGNPVQAAVILLRLNDSSQYVLCGRGLIPIEDFDFETVMPKEGEDYACWDELVELIYALKGRPIPGKSLRLN